jgi:hypothetical protein
MSTSERESTRTQQDSSVTTSSALITGSSWGDALIHALLHLEYTLDASGLEHDEHIELERAIDTIITFLDLAIQRQSE